MASFAWGACVAFIQLLLVIAGALMGSTALASDGPGGLVMVGMMAGLTALPAYDLVEGWIGMFARYRPLRYADRAHDAGRAVMAGVLSVGFVALSAATRSNAMQTAEENALQYGYGAAAVLVFGLLGAVPRAYFALREVPGAAIEADEPSLLRVAGTRGAVLVVCVSIGLWLGLYVGSVMGVQSARPAPAVAAARAVAPLSRTAITSFLGRLCRDATPDCPRARRARLVAPTSGALTLFYGGFENGATCLATFAPPHVAPLADHTVVQARAGDELAFDVALPPGEATCNFAGGFAE